MKYKLIFSDFDGTALRSDRTVSAKTVQAVKDYRAAGGTFIISTGRMYESVLKCADMFGLTDINMPISAMDGGIIKESLSGKVIALNTMPYEQTADFAYECDKLGCYCQVYTQDKLYVERENDINRDYCNITKIKMHPVGKLGDYILKNKLACVKVLIAADNADSYLDYFRDKYSDIQFFLSFTRFLDGASKKAGKGNALKLLAEYLGVDKSATVAIGDSMNDISMLESAALGVAVANADDRLKKSADIIAPSCDEDGVADIIYRALRDEL